MSQMSDQFKEKSKVIGEEIENQDKQLESIGLKLAKMKDRRKEMQSEWDEMEKLLGQVGRETIAMEQETLEQERI